MGTIGVTLNRGKMKWQKVQFLRLWTSLVNSFIPKRTTKTVAAEKYNPPPPTSQRPTHTHTQTHTPWGHESDIYTLDIPTQLISLFTSLSFLSLLSLSLGIAVWSISTTTCVKAASFLGAPPRATSSTTPWWSTAHRWGSYTHTHTHTHTHQQFISYLFSTCSHTPLIHLMKAHTFTLTDLVIRATHLCWFSIWIYYWTHAVVFISKYFVILCISRCTTWTKVCGQLNISPICDWLNMSFNKQLQWHAKDWVPLVKISVTVNN